MGGWRCTVAHSVPVARPRDVILQDVRRYGLLHGNLASCSGRAHPSHQRAVDTRAYASGREEVTGGKYEEEGETGDELSKSPLGILSVTLAVGGPPPGNGKWAVVPRKEVRSRELPSFGYRRYGVAGYETARSDFHVSLTLSPLKKKACYTNFNYCIPVFCRSRRGSSVATRVTSICARIPTRGKKTSRTKPNRRVYSQP